jgi:hypothetical protein
MEKILLRIFIYGNVKVKLSSRSSYGKKFLKVLHKLNARSSEWNENAEVAAQNLEENTQGRRRRETGPNNLGKYDHSNAVDLINSATGKRNPTQGSTTSTQRMGNINNKLSMVQDQK